MGSLIVLIYFIWRDSPGVALVVSLLSISVPLLLGWFTFYWRDMWLNVAPVMGGVLIHQMYESTKTSQELREKLQKKKERIRDLLRDLKAAKASEVKGALYHLADNLVTLIEELLHRSG